MTAHHNQNQMINTTPETRLLAAVARSAIRDAKHGSAENKRKARLWLAGHDAPIPLALVAEAADVPLNSVYQHVWNQLPTQE